MTKPIRLTVAMTHPIQYYSPWFRYLASDVPEIDLTVLYAAEPTPEQQGAQFSDRFTWDVPLRDGYESRVLSAPRDDTDFGSTSFWGLDVPELSAAIEATRPDIVLASGWHSVTLVRVLRTCRRVGIPLVYRGDSHLGSGRKGVLRRARTRWLLGHFDRYLSVGACAREFLDSYGVPDEHVFSSPHAVDNAFFERTAAPYRETPARRAARAELGISPDDFLVLFVGKLEPYKRPADVVRAVSRMDGRISVLMIGNGSSRDECGATASQLDVDVRLPGFWNQSELGKAYAISDVLVVPSVETWGLVVNEAMATGLPAVVSDRVGAAPDLVHRGRSGESYAFGDVDALARALDTVRSGTDRSAACRERAAAHSFGAASEGLVAACRSVVRHATMSA